MGTRTGDMMILSPEEIGDSRGDVGATLTPLELDSKFDFYIDFIM